MACNCKKKFDEIDKKYGDDNGVELENNFFIKILQFFVRFAFGIVCGAIIIIMIIPMLLFIILSLMFGKTIKIKLGTINKIFNKHNNGRN